MNDVSQPKRRKCCATCARPQSTCICAHIRLIANQVELLILQHPQEIKNAKNTLGLLQLSLTNNQVMIGETFSPPALVQALYAHQRQPLLLYPATPEDKALGIFCAPALAEFDLSNPHKLRLVIIDGTWRKSRKILYLNPLLQRLPRLSLESPPKSIYLIRKAQSENQLSTLEASCYALQQLEQHTDFAPLLTAFANFVTQQAACVPLAHLHSKSNRDPESL